MNRIFFTLSITLTMLLSSYAFTQELEWQRGDKENEARCNAGDGEGCLHRSKSQGDKWNTLAKIYLSDECTNGSGKSCYLLTVAHDRLRHPEHYDPFVDMQKSCVLGYAKGCRELAYLPRGKRRAGRKSADHYMLEACRLGHEVTCEELFDSAKNKLYQDLDGTLDSISRLEKLCDIDRPEACLLVGRSLRDGFLDMPSDPSTAHSHFVKACELGSKRGCAEEASDILFGVGMKADRTRALSTFQKLCHADEPEPLACGLLGWSKLATDKTEAIALMETSCKAKAGLACKLLADEHASGKLLPHNTKEAVALYDAGCKAGEMSACGVLAGILFDGAWTERDTTRAAKLGWAACITVSDATGCYVMGKLHPSGRTWSYGMNDVYYYDRGCQSEPHAACDAYAWHQCQDRNICTSKELEAIERALPLDKDGSYHNTHGLVLCKMGKTKEASAAYKKACTKNKDLCESTCPAK